MSFALNKSLRRLSGKPGVVNAFRFTIGRIRQILGDGQPAAAIGEVGPDAFAVSYLAHELTRKAVDANLSSIDVPTAAERKRKTVEAFLQREVLNANINEHETFGWHPALGAHVSDQTIGLNVLLRAKEIISEILGPVVKPFGSFGNGASVTLRRVDAPREWKFLKGSTTTLGGKTLATWAVEDSPVWKSSKGVGDIIYVGEDHRYTCTLPPGTVKVVPGGRFETVSKDAGIDRDIVLGTELNGFIQKGIGDTIRERLASWVYSTKVQLDGMDLNTSGDLNKGLARAGSVDGHIATVDAKAASNSITLAACEFLLPDLWFKLCCAARDPYVLIDGRYHRLAMMSGMGNGFTFELESVIFYAIGLAAAERSSLPFAEAYVSIHGDDLTIPSDVSCALIAAYGRLGVVVNQTKTFVRGPFRESCGGHYYCGHDVTPFYVKTQTGASRGDWFWLHNSLLLWLNCRTDAFLKTGKGRALVEWLEAIRLYASNGVPEVWAQGIQADRRSGIWGMDPTLKSGWPRSRSVIAREDDARDLPELGRYLVALRHPPRVLSVLDMCNHKSQVESSYEVVTSTREVERWRSHYGFVSSAYLLKRGLLHG